MYRKLLKAIKEIEHSNLHFLYLFIPAVSKDNRNETEVHVSGPR